MNEGIWSGRGSGPESLLEFNAGRLFREGKMVVPQKDKGKVVLIIQEGILHMKWYPRPSGKVVDDWMLFSGDASFERIKMVKDARVFVLKFQSNNREVFYWLQEIETDRDEFIEKRVNELIKNPHSKVDQKGMQEKLMGRFKKDEQKNTKTGGGLSKQMFNETLKSLGIGIDHDVTMKDTKKKGLRIDDVLDRSYIANLLRNDKSICEELVKYLPKGTECTPEAIEKHLRSPQFAQAVIQVDMALGTRQVDAKMLGMDVPSGIYDVEKIMEILHGEKFKKEDDDKMDIDK